MERVSKEKVKELCIKAYEHIGEGDGINLYKANLVLEAAQAMSDLICDEVVNPTSKEKMPFVILAMRQVLASLEKKYYIDAALASTFASFIGSREATPADKLGDVLRHAMRAMGGGRNEAEE